jgi:hypothetical protein
MCGPTTARLLPWRLLTDRSHRATVGSIPMIEMARTFGEARSVSASRPITEGAAALLLGAGATFLT